MKTNQDELRPVLNQFDNKFVATYVYDLEPPAASDDPDQDESLFEMAVTSLSKVIDDTFDSLHERYSPHLGVTFSTHNVYGPKVASKILQTYLDNRDEYGEFARLYVTFQITDPTAPTEKDKRPDLFVGLTYQFSIHFVTKDKPDQIIPVFPIGYTVAASYIRVPSKNRLDHHNTLVFDGRVLNDDLVHSCTFYRDFVIRGGLKNYLQYIEDQYRSLTHQDSGIDHQDVLNKLEAEIESYYNFRYENPESPIRAVYLFVVWFRVYDDKLELSLILSQNREDTQTTDLAVEDPGYQVAKSAENKVSLINEWTAAHLLTTSSKHESTGSGSPD